ncbi:endonuclease III [bacterium]|nr:endonuclease III [bacterium]
MSFAFQSYHDKGDFDTLPHMKGRSKFWPEQRKEELVDLLAELYPDPHSELNFKNDYQLLISVILSAQCTDKKVNEVTPELFARFPDFQSLAQGTEDEISTLIRQVNYYRSKARHLVQTGMMVSEQFGGEVPVQRKELESLPGVGRKTANVILSEKGIEPALAVDTHVYRVSRRLKLATRKDRDRVEQQLREKFPPHTWRDLHHRLIFHGRRVCKAQNPLCSSCALSHLCPSFCRT